MNHERIVKDKLRIFVSINRIRSGSLPVLHTWIACMGVLYEVGFGALQNALHYCYQLAFSSVTLAFPSQEKFP